MSTVLERIKAELAAFEEKKKAFVEELRKEFPTMFAPLFEKSKRIKSISWTQYTPFFNDGDSCEFGVNTDLGDYVNRDIDSEDDEDDDNGNNNWTSEYYKDDYDPVEAAILGEFEEVLESIPEEFMKDLFGDHVRVTITKDGKIDVSEYDHD